MAVQANENGNGSKGVSFDIFSISSIIFLGAVLVLLAQYGSKKIALSFAGLIFLTSLLMNIENLKGVFK